MITRLTPLLIVVAIAGGGCTYSATPRFVVTAEPLDVGVVSTRLCIAVDVNTRDGVWWWQPGASGCDSRSTGPSVFRADAAKVYAWHESRGHAAEFELQRILPRDSTEPPLARVRVVLREGRMTALATSVTVPTLVRENLEIPERAARR